jgi:hypothetical protein
MATIPAGTLLDGVFKVGMPLYDWHKLVCPWATGALTKHTADTRAQKSCVKFVNLVDTHA